MQLTSNCCEWQQWANLFVDGNPDFWCTLNDAHGGMTETWSFRYEGSSKLLDVLFIERFSKSDDLSVCWCLWFNMEPNLPYFCLPIWISIRTSEILTTLWRELCTVPHQHNSLFSFLFQSLCSKFLLHLEWSFSYSSYQTLNPQRIEYLLVSLSYLLH